MNINDVLINAISIFLFNLFTCVQIFNFFTENEANETLLRIFGFIFLSSINIIEFSAINWHLNDADRPNTSKNIFFFEILFIERKQKFKTYREKSFNYRYC